MRRRLKTARLTGAFGPTEVVFTPQQRCRGVEVDVRNCPHCGVHHASLDAELTGDRLTVECPSLRRPLVATFKLFLHPV